MRIARNYMIDVELVKKLQDREGSASELINQLLFDYFGSKEDVSDSIEELEKRKEILVNKQQEQEISIKKQQILKDNELPQKIKEWISKLQDRPNAITIFNACKAYAITLEPNMREKIIGLWEELNS